jgi:exosortase H (IPTLxxWG-CTERM-specific)
MKSNSSQIRLKYFLGICILSFVLIILSPDSLFAPFNHVTASLAGLCLNLFGRHAEVAGDVVSLNGFRVRIITECTALYCMVLFNSFVMSVPVALLSRLKGLLAGFAFLFTVNTLRIAVVVMVGAVYPGLFEIVHVYLMQVVMLLLVVAAALVWHRLVTRADGSDGPFLLRVAVLATTVFPVWLAVNTTYVQAMDRLVAGIFTIANYRLVINYQHMVYFQTFNIVLFIALILTERRLKWRGKLGWCMAGSLILVIGHLLFRIGNVLLTAFGWEYALKLTVSLSVIGEYLLPVLFWLAAIQGIPSRKYNT